MKKKWVLLMGISLIMMACTNSTQQQDKEDVEIEIPSTDSAPAIADLFLQNEGKYPHDIQLFDHENFNDRLKALLGDVYPSMIENFQTETPIVSENGIYKITGCKEHACPDFFTMILYDKDKDNLYVTIEKGEDKRMFLEKEMISLTETLKTK